ncbi:hypothetical protein MAR_000214, partial [Mya arenaria]
MESYMELTQSKDNQNWYKTLIGLHITKEGLVDFVIDVMKCFHRRTFDDINRKNGRPIGTLENDQLLMTEADIRTVVRITTEGLSDKIEELRNDLHEFNSEMHCTSSISPMIQEKRSKIVDFYVAPSIETISTNRRYSCKGDHISGKGSVSTFREIFNSAKGKSRYVYVSAKAGAGKTAFCQYVAAIWCALQRNDKEEIQTFKKNNKTGHFEDICVLKEYDFLFFVSLREIRDQLCDVDDMIFQQIVTNLSGECRLKESDLTVCIEINGIKGVRNDLLTEYVTSCLNSKYGKTKDVAEFRKVMESSFLETPHQDDSIPMGCSIANICSIPVMLMHILCLWYDDVSFGKSKCETYCNMISLLIEMANMDTSVEYNGDFELIGNVTSPEKPSVFKRMEDCLKLSSLKIQNVSLDGKLDLRSCPQLTSLKLEMISLEGTLDLSACPLLNALKLKNFTIEECLEINGLPALTSIVNRTICITSINENS